MPDETTRPPTLFDLIYDLNEARAAAARHKAQLETLAGVAATLEDRILAAMDAAGVACVHALDQVFTREPIGRGIPTSWALHARPSAYAGDVPLPAAPPCPMPETCLDCEAEALGERILQGTVAAFVIPDGSDYRDPGPPDAAIRRPADVLSNASVRAMLAAGD